MLNCQIISTVWCSIPHPAHPFIQSTRSFDVLFQLTVAVLACLLFLASAIPMPFNAAALPGGWHYNGDVGRSRFCCCCIGCCWVPGGGHYNGNVGRFCFCGCCWVYGGWHYNGDVCCCCCRIPRGCTSTKTLIGRVFTAAAVVTLALRCFSY